MIEFLIKYGVGLPLMLLGSIAVGSLWLFVEQPINALVRGILLIIWLCVMIYETGFKKYYRHGRKIFFYWVFLVPAILGTVIYLVGMIWKFG